MRHHLLRGFVISLLLHGVGLCSIIYLGALLPDLTPPLVIDFSIEKTCNNCQSCNCPKKLATAASKKVSAQPDPPVGKVPPVSTPKPVKEKIKKVEIKKSEPKKAEIKKLAPKKILPVKTKKRPVVEEKVVIAAVEPIPEAVPESVRAEVPSKEIKVIEEEFVESTIDTFSKEGPSVSQEAVALVPATVPEAPSPSLKEQYIKANFAYIKDTVQLKTSYPGIARRMGWEGKVLVSFIVGANGQVEDIRIIESCGFSALDKNAIKTIEQCAPFPKPPVRAELTLPITYRLN
jgi:protein TonB